MSENRDYSAEGVSDENRTIPADDDSKSVSSMSTWMTTPEADEERVYYERRHLTSTAPTVYYKESYVRAESSSTPHWSTSSSDRVHVLMPSSSRSIEDQSDADENTRLVLNVLAIGPIDSELDPNNGSIESILSDLPNEAIDYLMETAGEYLDAEGFSNDVMDQPHYNQPTIHISDIH
ncbi:hypothetical protein TRVA0_001S08174 [Trichomonascus vanleenenianus]|uniref:uncharacterized protein n=1 Tax=Trichomonascus vanleenenianus TaxID=2268995 RepID=UPI003ECBA03C